MAKQLSYDAYTRKQGTFTAAEHHVYAQACRLLRSYHRIVNNETMLTEIQSVIQQQHNRIEQGKINGVDVGPLGSNESRAKLAHQRLNEAHEELLRLKDEGYMVDIQFRIPDGEVKLLQTYDLIDSTIEEAKRNLRNELRRARKAQQPKQTPETER